MDSAHPPTLLSVLFPSPLSLHFLYAKCYTVHNYYKCLVFFYITVIIAPQLHPKTHSLIHFLLSYRFPPRVIAAQARYSTHAVKQISCKDPIKIARQARSRVSRRSRISKPMRKFLRNALINKPNLYQNKLADLLHEEFREKVSEKSISQALHAIN